MNSQQLAVEFDTVRYQHTEASSSPDRPRREEEVEEEEARHILLPQDDDNTLNDEKPALARHCGSGVC